MLMIGQARDQWTPKPANFYLYVEDVDAAYRRAVEAGAKSLQEPADQAYGDRTGGVEDSLGNQWWVGCPTLRTSRRRRSSAAIARWRRRRPLTSRDNLRQC